MWRRWWNEDMRALMRGWPVVHVAGFVVAGIALLVPDLGIPVPATVRVVLGIAGGALCGLSFPAARQWVRHGATEER